MNLKTTWVANAKQKKENCLLVDIIRELVKLTLLMGGR